LEFIKIGGQIDAIHTDLKKTFDSVNINLLIIKLRNLGMVDPLYSWLESYLRDRKQQVIINGNISHKFEVHLGVPQGGHLSPLLFLIFFNDIRFSFNHC
jgi:hypothetical protein